MDLKRILKSKGFLVSVFIIAIVGILAACWFFSSNPKNEFQPEETSSETETSEWQDTPAPTEAPAEASKSSRHDSTQSSVAEEYPKVVEESDTEVVIDFLPESSEQQTTPPEPPVSQDDATNPDEAPTYEPEDVNPEPSSPAADDNTPEPGSGNGNGAVYDPVFGWVVPGEAQQSVGDSNGDINKMVGNMGN